jgi:exodeoxyribonuclease-3
VVIAGDYNVIPTELDVYKPERWVDDALFRPETREAFQRLLDQGWTDALRALHPDETIYTFFDYFRNAFGRNAGLRIDHLLLSPSLAPQLKAAGVDREVRGREKPSDHAPTWVEFDWPSPWPDGIQALRCGRAIAMPRRSALAMTVSMSGS